MFRWLYKKIDHLTLSLLTGVLLVISPASKHKETSSGTRLGGHLPRSADTDPLDAGSPSNKSDVLFWVGRTKWHVFFIQCFSGHSSSRCSASDHSNVVNVHIVWHTSQSHVFNQHNVKRVLMWHQLGIRLFDVETEKYVYFALKLHKPLWLNI